MSTDTDLKDQVIERLSSKGYPFLKPLGEGGFASVLSFLSPQNEEVAAKIIEQRNSWHVEEEIWPILSHPNVLRVIEVVSLDRAKVYLMPAMPCALDERVLGRDFRNDVSGLVRIRKWTHEVLCALEYLHSAGFCHLDVNSDNVLLSHSDTAVLADFSGLNLAGCHVERLCSPLNFRPPECFGPASSRYIEGQSYDMWTFGLMTLNVLTGHWLQYMLNNATEEGWSWHSVVLPLLKENLKEANFSYLMKKSLPCANISANDLAEAWNFVLNLLRYNPKDRPSASVAKMHPFVANLKEENNPVQSPTDAVQQHISTDETDVKKYDHASRAPEEDCPPVRRDRTAYDVNCPLEERNRAVSGAENAEMYFAEPHEVKSSKAKPLQKIRKWLRNVKNKFEGRKVKYVPLSNEDEV